MLASDPSTSLEALGNPAIGPGDKSRTKGQKILVQWHLNPDAVVKHIDRFDGLRPLERMEKRCSEADQNSVRPSGAPSSCYN